MYQIVTLTTEIKSFKHALSLSKLNTNINHFRNVKVHVLCQGHLTGTEKNMLHLTVHLGHNTSWLCDDLHAYRFQ